MTSYWLQVILSLMSLPGKYYRCLQGTAAYQSFVPPRSGLTRHWLGGRCCTHRRHCSPRISLTIHRRSSVGGLKKIITFLPLNLRCYLFKRERFSLLGRFIFCPYFINGRPCGINSSRAATSRLLVRGTFHALFSGGWPGSSYTGNFTKKSHGKSVFLICICA